MVRTAEHRAPGVGLADVLQRVLPALQELGPAHEVGPEDDRPVVVEVPDGEQRARGVAVLRDPLLREEADVARVPDLQAGKVGLGVGGRGVLTVRVTVLRLVVHALIGIVARFRLDRPEPQGDHAAVVRPGGGAVPDRLERVRDAGRVRAEDHRLDTAVQTAPRQDVVGGAVGRSRLAGAEGGQIRRVVAPAEAPVGRTGSVGRAQDPGIGVVHLHAVAHIGARRDGERQKRSAWAPGHLAHVPEGGLRPRRQRDDAEVGALARRLVRRIAAQRHVPPGGVEAPLGDRLELADFPGLQIHHRSLLAHRLVALRQPLPLLRRQPDGPGQPAPVGGESRLRPPRKDASGVLFDPAHAEFRRLVHPRDLIGDPVTEWRELDTPKSLPAAIVVRRDERSLLGGSGGREDERETAKRGERRKRPETGGEGPSHRALL